MEFPDKAELIESVESTEPALKVPEWIMKLVSKREDGKPRDKQHVAWFFRMLETGEATQSAIDVGYSVSNASWHAWDLKKRFGNLLPNALMFSRGWQEPKALKMLQYAMERAMHPENKDNPQMLTVGVKASSEILDRGGMPKGAFIKGIPITGVEKREEGDFRKAIDILVAKVGVDAVRHMPEFMEYKLYREYFEEKHGTLREINPVDPTQEEPDA